MTNRPGPFKQSDVTRAIKGFLASGLPVGAARIEKDGTIVILASASEAVQRSRPDPDELL